MAHRSGDFNPEGVLLVLVLRVPSLLTCLERQGQGLHLPPVNLGGAPAFCWTGQLTGPSVLFNAPNAHCNSF